MSRSYYLRLMRSSDLPLIKKEHRALFGFDLQISDEAFMEAITSSRWVSQEEAAS
jgi:hypothetical protein